MRSRGFFVAMVAVFVSFAGACRQETSPQKAPRPVRTRTVEPVSGRARMRYSANIAPREKVSVAFKVSGYVREVRQARGADGRMRNLQEGDVVTRGTVLARVREEDYTEAVNRAKASVGQAQAGLQKATLDYERAKNLFASESLTKPDYDSAKAAFDAAVLQAEGARASLAEAEIRLRDTALATPLDGVILSRSIEVGSLVGPGSVAFEIADTSSVKAVFGVPDILMRRVQLGIVLQVTTESLGGRQFPGRITAVAPAADPSSRVFDVELTIPNPHNVLKAGMIATVEVPEENPEAARAQAAALVVPLVAIVKPPHGEHFAVFVLVGQGTNQVARLRPVEVGEVYGNMVAIRKGLQRGERVVVSAASLLADNEAVQVIP